MLWWHVSPDRRIDECGLKLNRLEKMLKKFHANLSLMPRIRVMKRLCKPEKVMQGSVVKEPMRRARPLHRVE
jgi:hypothetical protein